MKYKEPLFFSSNRRVSHNDAVFRVTGMWFRTSTFINFELDLQALIAESKEPEVKIVMSLLQSHITQIAMDRYGSIFLQKAFHYMHQKNVYALVSEIHGLELPLAVHCYASYFVQVCFIYSFSFLYFAVKLQSFSCDLIETGHPLRILLFGRGRRACAKVCRN